MTLRPIDARSGETRAAGLDGEATKAGCPKGRPNNPKEIRTMPDPLVEQTALTLRPEVLAFAQLMERQLRANDHKRGWQADSADDLVERMLEEADELKNALSRDDRRIAWAGGWQMEDTRVAVGNEAADVANFAMMVADVRGALPALPSVTEGREEIAREEEATAAFNAIIARMQEPDEAMIEAGEQVAVQPFIPAGKFTVLTWQAMLSSMEQG